MILTVAIVATLVIGLYVGVMIRLRVVAQSDHDDLVAAAEDTLRSEVARVEELQTDLYQAVQAAYGEAVADKVRNAIVWVGMPEHLLYAALGKPGKVVDNLVRGVRKQKWLYGGEENRLGNMKYKHEILIQNGLVVGWKELT